MGDHFGDAIGCKFFCKTVLQIAQCLASHLLLSPLRPLAASASRLGRSCVRSVEHFVFQDK